MKRVWGVLFALAFLTVACETNTTIANNLHERDANEIVVLLRSREVEAIKIPAPVSTTGGGNQVQLWNISVPAKQTTDALAVLNQSGLPRTRGTNLLDLFGSQGLVPSELQNQIRYQEGLSEQLANTIRTMDGVINASVQITFPKEDEEKIPLTASVYVKHRGILDNPNSLLVNKIKRLVASAIPGLTIENVSVVADRALFADISLESLDDAMEKEYVSIWGVTLARESTALFRAYFYSFLVIIFLLICLIVWLIWKTFSIMRRHGWRGFFSPTPYAYEMVNEQAQQNEEEQEDFDDEGMEGEEI